MNTVTISDIVMMAIREKNFASLVPIIEKYNGEYKRKYLMGDMYKEYVSKVYFEYNKTRK